MTIYCKRQDARPDPAGHSLGESQGSFINFAGAASNIAVGAGYNFEGGVSDGGTGSASISIGPMFGASFSRTNTHVLSFSGLLTDKSCGVAC